MASKDRSAARDHVARAHGNRLALGLPDGVETYRPWGFLIGCPSGLHADVGRCECYRLSQNESPDPHTGRDASTEEEPCTSAAPTAGARGSEDTPATSTTASAGSESAATEVGGTFTTKTAPDAKATGALSSVSGPSDSDQVLVEPVQGRWLDEREREGWRLVREDASGRRTEVMFL